MKHALLFLLAIAAASLLNGCATTDTATTGTGDPVPGQVKSTEESRLQPGINGGGTPNASVKW